jgi:hypothetical protein
MCDAGSTYVLCRLYARLMQAQHKFDVGSTRMFIVPIVYNSLSVLELRFNLPHVSVWSFASYFILRLIFVLLRIHCWLFLLLNVFFSLIYFYFFIIVLFYIYARLARPKMIIELSIIRMLLLKRSSCACLSWVEQITIWCLLDLPDFL